MRSNPAPLTGPQRWIRAGIAAILATVLAVVAFTEPRISLPFINAPCGFHGITGLPCALCGGTRAAHALLRGDPARAATLNLLAFPAVATLLLAASVLLVEATAGRDLARWVTLGRTASRWIPLAIVLLIVWWIPHILLAVRSGNTDLVDLQNPVAAALRDRLGK